MTPSWMFHPPSCRAAQASSSTGSSFSILPSPTSPRSPSCQAHGGDRPSVVAGAPGCCPWSTCWQARRVAWCFAGLSRSGWAAAQARQIPHSSSLSCAACLPSLHANSKHAVIIPDALNNCGYFFSSQYSKKAKNSLRFLSQLFFLTLFSFLPTTSVTLKNQADELTGSLCLHPLPSRASAAALTAPCGQGQSWWWSSPGLAVVSRIRPIWHLAHRLPWSRLGMRWGCSLHRRLGQGHGILPVPLTS